MENRPVYNQLDFRTKRGDQRTFYATETTNFSRNGQPWASKSRPRRSGHDNPYCKMLIAPLVLRMASISNVTLKVKLAFITLSYLIYGTPKTAKKS